MAADGRNKRRLAADARRVVQQGPDRSTTSQIRKLLKVNYDRGVEDGRAQVVAENSVVDVRTTLLNMHADAIDLSVGYLAAVPNSGRALSALREATSILRDAAAAGEAPNGEDEAEDEKEGAKSG